MSDHGSRPAEDAGLETDRLEILAPRIDAYLHALEAPADGIRAEMEQYATEHHFPIVGPLVGRLLQLLVILSGARRIFDMGSGFGYSAWWMAHALPADGVLECAEGSAQNIERGRQWLERAGLGPRVVWHAGDALRQLSVARHTYDLIFCDVDKVQYPEALRIAWPRIRAGGCMVTDNVLWSGRVVSQLPATPDTAAIRKFVQASRALPDAVCSLIPIRDGVLIAVKR